MKLEKVVSRSRAVFWVILFFLAVGLLATLGTVYNVEITDRTGLSAAELPWLKIILGTLGFIGVLLATILFFFRLLKEIRVNQVQSDFLDRISHELRTPLSSLTLLSNLLKKPQDLNEAEKLWKAHDHELSRLKNDVELLLKAARLRDTKIKPELEEFRLRDWFQQERTHFEMISEGKLNLELMISPDLFVRADQELLRLILQNLLSNAKKFSPPSSQVVLRVSEPRSKRFRIEVIDQGMGFQPREKERLFKRFSRLTFETLTPSARTIPGTGLGLFLAASAARSLGYTLQGQSPGPGLGAIFSLQGVSHHRPLRAVQTQQESV